MNLIRYIILLASIISLASCSGTRGLQPEDKLFVGTQVTYSDFENVKFKKQFKENIKANFLKQNTPGILNVKTGIYNLFESTSNKGLKHNIRSRMGSAPVVFNESMVSITEKRLEKSIKEDGFLRADIKCDSTLVKKRKVSIECVANLGKRYIIDSVFYIQDTLNITKVLKPMYDIEYTKSGDYYQLTNLKSDRDQFVTTANNNGYPFVNHQDVIFFVDTTKNSHKVNVHMRLRPTQDSIKYDRVRYGGIYINPNFSLDTDDPTDISEMKKYDEFQIVDGYDFLRESAINEAIFIDEGQIYNQSKNKITTDRLLDFGLFKFVNVKTKLNPDRTLDHHINLTTYKMQSITGELQINNRQGNFWGIAGQTTYTNKNIFKGAERLDLTLSGGLEKQFGDSISTYNTSDLKLQASLTMPSIVLPFKSFRTNRNFIPKTFTSLSVSQQNRIDLYKVRSANVKYGFKWNETEYKSSFFSPIDLSWLVLSSTTGEFDQYLIDNPILAESFRTTLLLGSSYEYVFNKRDKFNPVNQTYFKGVIESAGNLLSLFSKSNVPGQAAEVFGTPYSQYVRLTADVRKYWALNIGSIASRMVVGTGFAYGNSNNLPYAKQYAIGGANSLRAFRLRTIGPGAYQFTGTLGDQNFDQTGDVKIEANVEYRFPIIGYFKGAAFIDAGNVWLRESTTRPEGVFKFDNFVNQLAVGTGLGLRFDLDFLLLRLDIAFPVRNLNEATGKFNWLLDDIDLLSKSWRTDNLVYNIGIGYPF